MSDATLLPPRSSAAPGIFDGKTSNSSGNDAEIDFNASLLEVSSQDANEEKSSDSGGKVPGKQKRKRTRYASLSNLHLQSVGRHKEFPRNWHYRCS